MLTEVQTHNAPDGRSRLLIKQRDDTFFMFSAEILDDFDQTASPGHESCFLPLTSLSGIYQDADDAEAEGRRLLGWNREI